MPAVVTARSSVQVSCVPDAVDSEELGWHGRESSIVLDLPPLALVMLKKGPA